MRHLRSAGIFGSLIAVLALLLTEVGHSLAHHHAAEHGAPSHFTGHQDAGPPATGGDGTVAAESGAGDHPHLDLAATLPAKPLLVQAVVVLVAALLVQELGEERPLPPVWTAGLSPGDWDHGPPPPSRAPPQV